MVNFKTHQGCLHWTCATHTDQSGCWSYVAFLVTQQQLVYSLKLDAFSLNKCFWQVSQRVTMSEMGRGFESVGVLSALSEV